MDKPLEKNEKFGGLYSPNTTPVPDNFFDELMPNLSGAELKVVLYIIRRTFGFKRSSDTISISQMLDGITKRNGEILDYGTGLAKSTLMIAIKSLSEREIIIPQRRFDMKGGNIATEYAVNVRVAKPERKTVETVEDKYQTPSPKIGTRVKFRKSVQVGSENANKPVYRKSDPQETGIQETVNTTVNGSTDKKKIKGGSKSGAGKTSPLHDLPNQKTSKYDIESTAEWILEQLGDTKSTNFYYLVATKVPRQVIDENLGNIKTFGANNPASLFNHRMTKWASERKVEIEGKARLAEIREVVVGRHQDAGSMESVASLLGA